MSHRNHDRAEDEDGKSFDPRYLAAKKSIDDRALNHHVWDALRQALSQITGDEPCSILEIGSGIGTMFQRVVERDLLTGPVTYLATDNDPNQLKAARKYLTDWAEQQPHTLSWSSEYQGRLRTAKADISLALHLASAKELAESALKPGPFHLMLAHAVLDLIDFPAILPRLLEQLVDKGLAYFTCNFDGETVFLPECEGEREILRLYHASMDARLAGASHTGRRILTFVQRPGLELLAAGSSDWIIPPRNSCYSSDEIFFLHSIIETVDQELSKTNRPLLGLETWTRHRHRQVEAGTLSLLARHLDLLIQRRPSSP
ncbi:MAG: class I SAM-dependent methyltransferase [Desulforhopalus sp.]